MAFRDNLRPATWRGIPFFVDASDVTVGRRTVVHEYPERDLPYAEDLGRATRTFNVVGFLLGDDYTTTRDQLVDAAETYGPGPLVHPLYGSLSVALSGPLQITETAGEQRICRLSFSFVEAGALTFPTAVSSPYTATYQAAAAVEVSAAADFVTTWSVDGFPEWVKESGVASVAEQTAALSTELGRKSADVIGQVADVAALLNSIDAQAIALVGSPSDLITQMGAAWTLIASRKIYRAMAAAAGFDGSTSETTASEIAADNNDAALRRWVVRASLAGIVRELGTEDLVSYDDAVAILADVSGLIDDEAAQAVDSDAYDALVDLRAALLTTVRFAALNLPRLRDVTVPGMTSALELCQRLYADAERWQELVDRNGWPHPGFVPPGTIKALAS